MTSITLYELAEDYRQALETLNDPEYDLPAEAIADTLEGLSGSFENKAVNVAKFFKNLEATSVAIKEAEQRMSQRRKAIENRVASMKDYLKQNMESCGITRIESPWFALSIAKNPAAVDVFDEAAVPAEYKEEIVTVKIDKTAIKQAIESGADVPGAVLTRGTRLAIR